MSSGPSTLLQLLERTSSRAFASEPAEDLGTAQTPPFPFLGIVGQQEVKLALLLVLINPQVGGTLLIGPRGTGKTSAVRGLTDLLPKVPRSLCPYGCTEEELEDGGLDAVCPTCAQKYGHGEPLTALDRVRLIELPLNAQLDDVVGGINERIAIEQQRVRLERGILALADQNILYIDEVNLLHNAIVNAVLDAAAQGSYAVRRGPLRMTYRARLTLVGSMNPEEGTLRPQIMDRFGLRVVVRAIEDGAQRMEIYRRARAYAENPHEMSGRWLESTLVAAEEVQRARALLPHVDLDTDASATGLDLIKQLEIDSHRAEFTLFEAARAHAAADLRSVATIDDLSSVAKIALRMRRSAFMRSFLEAQSQEDREIQAALRGVRCNGES